jgi:hypothetical protein
MMKTTCDTERLAHLVRPTGCWSPNRALAAEPIVERLSGMPTPSWSDRHC